MAVSIGGLISIIVFYLLILAFGIWASRKSKQNADSEDFILAGRSIGLFVGIFTMTATWVGGGYINGSSEIVASSGLLWCQAPVGYTLALCFGGLFFAKKLRTKRYATMLDPYQKKYGEVMASLLYIPAFCGETFWSAAILNALGGTLSVILDLDQRIAVVVSAAISLLYTLLGGLYSVAYTDVVQLICMFVGLWLSVPFAITHEAVQSISVNSTENWVKSVAPSDIGLYIDGFLLLIFGGIPWQVYFQRVLSAKSVPIAKGLSFAGAIGCCIMVIPAVLIGAAGATADWNQTAYPYPEQVSSNYSLILPLVLRYLCPVWVGIIALGAVSAAVMSSTDSSLLSASSMFSRNVFGALWLKFKGTKPKEIVLLWVMRGAQVIIAIIATVMALTVQSIYVLFYLCSDLVFVILFPQLTCVIYFPYSNTYGSLAGFTTGLLFRLIGGEPSLGIPAVLYYPWFVEASGDAPEAQRFPFKTLAMLISFITIVIVSSITHYLFTSNCLSKKFDIFRCFKENPEQGTEMSDRKGKVNIGFSSNSYVVNSSNNKTD